MSKVFLFVNGIRTFPGSSKNWNGRAVTATHNRFCETTERAEKVEYFTLAVSRPFGQGYRADKLLKVARYYSQPGRNWDKVIVAHSNGADVVLDAMRKSPFKVEAMHIISGAVDRNCKKNGLAELCASGRIGHLYVWVAKKDSVLGLGGSLFGRLFGYGDLGLNGPVNLPRNTYTLIEQADFGHSDWFTSQNFIKTLEIVWGDRVIDDKTICF
jgi:hypothetical protein